MTSIVLALLGEIANNHVFLLRVVRRQHQLIAALSLCLMVLALINLVYIVINWPRG